MTVLGRSGQGRAARLLDGPFGSIVLPAAIFQIVLVGPGFSTGREVVEFAGRFGADGVWSVGVIAIGFAILCTLAFEVARIVRAFNYREYIRHLIGPAWPAFDALWIVFTLLITGLVTSAIGTVLADTFGIPPLVGTVGVLLVVAGILLAGRSTIEGFDLVGSILFTVGICCFSIVVLGQRWDEVGRVLGGGAGGPSGGSDVGGAVWAGVLYVAYNIPTMVPVLFCLDRQRHRSEVVASGLLASVLVTVPFALTFLALLGFSAQGIADAPIPWLVMFEAVGGQVLTVFFAIVLTYAVIDTTTSMVHAFLDRIDDALEEAGRPHLTARPRTLVVLGMLVAAFGLSQLGVIALVAQGYTLLAYGFLLVFVLPLVTRGLYLVVTAPRRMSASPSPAMPAPRSRSS